MAMSSSRLQAALFARFKPLWRNEAASGNDWNEDWWLDQLAKVIAEEVITEITGNAKCNGTDSGGDSHPNVGIV